MSCDSAKLGCMLMSSFFFFNKFILFIYLFLAALGLRCCVLALSSCGEQGLLFVAVRGLLVAVAPLIAEHGLQAHRLQQLWLVSSRAQAQQLWHTGLVALRHVGSSWTKARTRVPCIVRWILNYCATREAPPTSFLILIPLSFFLLVSLAKGLSILFIFSKNQLLVSLTFYIVFLVSISFISTLIFVISFLLLTLGFICPFSGSQVVYLSFFCFLRQVFIMMNFPLRTAFAASHEVWYVVISFSFISYYFLKFLF